MKQHLDFGMGLAFGLFVGFIFGFVGTLWAINEPIERHEVKTFLESRK